MDFDQKRVLTLVGTLVLAAAVVVGAIYGPSAWKVLLPQTAKEDPDTLVQTPPVIPASSNVATAIDATAANTTTTPQTNTGAKKYKDPDRQLMSLAPSLATYFAGGTGTGLSATAQGVAFDASWNIHQYLDGYLFGPTAGPQMNDGDIKKYIVFHKAVWDKQLKSEQSTVQAAAFIQYMDVLFNRGIDAFDTKDRVRIEQFHQELHDLDAHLFRNDVNAKIYGATPFATKR